MFVVVVERKDCCSAHFDKDRNNSLSHDDPVVLPNIPVDDMAADSVGEGYTSCPE